LQSQKTSSALARYGIGPRRDENFMVDSNRANMAIGCVIFINAITIGVETDHACRECELKDRLGWYVLENIFVVIFSIEMVARIHAHRLRYFLDPWNIMDFCLVNLAILDTWILTASGADVNLKALSALRVLRMLRLVRLVRLLRMFRELWLIVSGMIDSLKTIVWVVILLCVIVFVVGVFFTQVVGKLDGGDEVYDYSNTYWKRADYWGTVPRSMYTMFQVMTLDSWSMNVARPLVKDNFAWAVVFVAFIFVVTFGLMNIVVAIICENILCAAQNNEEKIQQLMEKERSRVLESLRGVFEAADTDKSGAMDFREFQSALARKHVKEKLALIDIPVHDLEELFKLLDDDQSGEITIDEFFQGCEKLKGVAKGRDMITLSMNVQKCLRRVDGMSEVCDRQHDRLEDVIGRIDSMWNEFFVWGGQPPPRGAVQAATTSPPKSRKSTGAPPPPPPPVAGQQKSKLAGASLRGPRATQPTMVAAPMAVPGPPALLPGSVG